MNLLRTALLQEIEFWQNMLLESELDQDSSEYLSMLSALELAQMQLKGIPTKPASDNDHIVTISYH